MLFFLLLRGHNISIMKKKNAPPQPLYPGESLPNECAAVVLELKKRPSPRSPSFTTPVAVMNTLAGFISDKKEKLKKIYNSQWGCKKSYCSTNNRLKEAAIDSSY